MKHFLATLTERLESKPADLELVSFYFVTNPPPIMPFPVYVKRILDESGCGPEVLICACTWLKRLGRMRPGLDISAWTLHRLFLAAMVVAIKYCNDFYWDNTEYATIGGITLGELNKLELIFAHQLMDWRLFVDTERDEEYRDLYLAAILGG